MNSKTQSALKEYKAARQPQNIAQGVLDLCVSEVLNREIPSQSQEQFAHSFTELQFDQHLRITNGFPLLQNPPSSDPAVSSCSSSQSSSMNSSSSIIAPSADSVELDDTQRRRRPRWCWLELFRDAASSSNIEGMFCPLHSSFVSHRNQTSSLGFVLSSCFFRFSPFGLMYSLSV